MSQSLSPEIPEYAVAFRSLRKGKCICMLAILVCLVFELMGFYMVRFQGVIDAAVSKTAKHRVEEAKTTLATQPAEPAEADEQSQADEVMASAEASRSNDEKLASAARWKRFLVWTMHTAKMLAPMLGVLLTTIILLAVLFSLVGRLGGVAGLTSALMWSLVLLVLLCPWQQILRDRFACGAMYSLNELISHTRIVHSAWGAADVPGRHVFLYLARFAIVPIFTILMWLVILVKFAGGSRRMSLPTLPVTSPTSEPAAQ